MINSKNYNPTETELRYKLVDILEIPSTCDNNTLLSHYILSECSKIEGLEVLVDYAGNILITKGKDNKPKFYPAVTAHLDTVHDYRKIDVWLSGGKLYSNTGIGGDDKCGVFICLELLKTLPVLKVMLFVGEECGCIGSDKFDLSFIKDCGYIIALDRRGNNDYINYYWGSKSTSRKFDRAVRKAIKSYGYSSEDGLITDVFNLIGKKIDLSCCNLSVGYYRPHSSNEFVVINDVYNAMKLTKNMIQLLGCKRFGYNYISRGYSYFNFDDDYYNRKSLPVKSSPYPHKYVEDTYVKGIDMIAQCHYCGGKFFMKELELIEHAGYLCELCKDKLGIGGNSIDKSNVKTKQCAFCEASFNVDDLIFINGIGLLCYDCLKSMDDKTLEYFESKGNDIKLLSESTVEDVSNDTSIINAIDEVEELNDIREELIKKNKLKDENDDDGDCAG